jgi:hypothetical protein
MGGHGQPRLSGDRAMGRGGCRAGSAQLDSSWLVKITSWLGSTRYVNELKI